MKPARARILIVDDEPALCSAIKDELAAVGYSVAIAANTSEATQELARAAFEVLVLNVNPSRQDDLSFLRELKRLKPSQAVITMTAYGSAETAVEAMKLGAFDDLQKPFSSEELLMKLDKLLQYEQMASENDALRRQLAMRRIEGRIIGQSQSIKGLVEQIYAAASTEATVLIEGENGTGKELIAHTIHENSSRAAGPFAAIACADFRGDLLESELFGPVPGGSSGTARRRTGRFELARGGTLFLDDVDDIPVETQGELVRVLHRRAFERSGEQRPIPVDVRLIAATKRPLSTMVATGEFHEDFFVILNIVSLKIPPLRERAGDIPLLVEHFLEKSGFKTNENPLSLSPEAIVRLQRHSWPGNIRELEQVLETMIAEAKGKRLDAADVPELAVSQEKSALLSLKISEIERINIGSVLDDMEIRLIHWALERTAGNLAKAAELLGLPRSTLQYKINRLASSTNTLASRN